MAPKYRTTQEAADKIGISKRQLLRWIYAGKIPEVARQRINPGLEIRLWTAADIRRAAIKSSRFRNKIPKSSE